MVATKEFSHLSKPSYIKELVISVLSQLSITWLKRSRRKELYIFMRPLHPSACSQLIIEITRFSAGKYVNKKDTIL